MVHCIVTLKDEQRLKGLEGDKWRVTIDKEDRIIESSKVSFYRDSYENVLKTINPDEVKKIVISDNYDMVFRLDLEEGKSDKIVNIESDGETRPKKMGLDRKSVV